MKKITAILALVLALLSVEKSRSTELVGLPMIYFDDDGSLKRKTIDAQCHEGIEGIKATIGLLTIKEEDVPDGADPLFLCFAFLKGRELQYGEVKANICMTFPLTFDHYHVEIPRELISATVPNQDLPGIIRIKQPNGWMWLIKAKDQTEAHYLNVRLTPRYRPFCLLAGEALSLKEKRFTH